MVALISMVCLIAVANFGDSMGHMFCDLYDNNPKNSDRAGLGFSSSDGSGDKYTWDSALHSCKAVGGGGLGFGGGGLG